MVVVEAEDQGWLKGGIRKTTDRIENFQNLHRKINNSLA